MKILSTICFIKSIYYTIKYNIFLNFNAYISGHEFIAEKNNHGPFKDPIICRVCGYKSYPKRSK